LPSRFFDSDADGHFARRALRHAMAGSLWPAVRNAGLIGTTAGLLFAPRRPGATSTTAPAAFSCAGALAKGKELLGQRRYGQAEDVLALASRECPKAADIYNTLGL